MFHTLIWVEVAILEYFHISLAWDDKVVINGE